MTKRLIRKNQMSKRTSLIGKRFGRLVVKRFAGTDRFGNLRWECVCDCGNETVVRTNALRTGNTKSCGCLQREITSTNFRTHGLSQGAHGETPRLYFVWTAMRKRCRNPKDKHHIYYGNRGITVCEEWSDYQKFHDWSMSNGYRSGLTIERIDNNGNYEPNNCKWIPQKEQGWNTRKNRLITFHNATKCLAEWALKLGMNDGTLRSRVHRGWTTERAFTEPVNKPKRKRGDNEF